MQGVFVGPARSGKSSLIHRLLKEKVSSSSPSTGAADKIIQVGVKKSSSIPLSVVDSEWFRLTYSSEAIRLMVMVAGNQDTSKRHCSSGVSQDLSLQNLYPVGMPDGYLPPKQVFEEALRDESFEGALRRGVIVTLREHFDGSWSLYISDTGGQMEFQEILPLLVSGPSLFFIVFPLHRDLNDLFTIEYRLPDGQRSEPYKSSLTLKEAILQSLATIAAMGTFTYKGLSKEKKLKPKALLVGTHKDQLDPDPNVAQLKVEEIDRNLQEIIKSMSYFHKGLVESATKNQMIFAVNNLAKSDDDFALIRSRVNTIANYPEYRMSIPTHWLIFSLVLRGLTGPVITFEECFQTAQQCGIDNEEELHEALWFLHTKMGVIRYFRHGDVSKVVIIDPQLLFDKVTKMIVKTFTFDRGTRMSEEFQKKGIFTLKDFLLINESEDSLLTHKRFFELLENLRILVPLPDKETYLLPCVWAHANEASFSPRRHSKVPILALTFSCGYCPKGVTGALIKYLMTNEMQSTKGWELIKDEIFRNRVTFKVGTGLITLYMYPTHFEVACAHSTCTLHSVHKCCYVVKKTVVAAIEAVTRDLNLTCHCGPSFHCTLCKTHVAKFLYDEEDDEAQLFCGKCNEICAVPDGFRYWMTAPGQRGGEEAAPVTLPSALDLLTPVAAKWDSIGSFLDIKQGTLDTIRRDNGGICNNCLREMLCTWIWNSNYTCWCSRKI